MANPVVTIANYGTDMAVKPNADGIMDILPTLQYATGIDVLAQSLVCRQICVPNSVIDSPNETMDLRLLIKARLTQAALAGLPSQVQKLLARDQRVKGVSVTGSFDTVTQTLTLIEQITTATGAFTLTIALTPATVSAVVSGIIGSP